MNTFPSNFNYFYPHSHHHKVSERPTWKLTFNKVCFGNTMTVMS